MPPKAQADPNASAAFLHLCMQKSDLSTINFNDVAEALNINPQAARMRYYRLKKVLENTEGDDSEAISNPPTPVKEASVKSTPTKPARTKSTPTKRVARAVVKAPKDSETPTKVTGAKRRKMEQPKEETDQPSVEKGGLPDAVPNSS